jgi:hypothetical protein
MICPSCEQYVVVQKPTECTNCHTAVSICKPCFGTGKIEAWGGGFEHIGHREMLVCADCGGHGLVKPVQSGQAT